MTRHPYSVVLARVAVAMSLTSLCSATGCFGDVPATSPWDTAAPEESQSRAEIQGTVTLEPQVGTALDSAGTDITLVSGGGAATVTDDAGGFVLADVPAGTWDISVRRDGYAGVTVRGVVVDFDRMARGAIALDPIMLQLGRGILQGSLILSDGAKPQEASVVVDDGVAVATLSGSGRFVLSGLVAGAHTLVFAQSGYVPVTLTGVVVQASQSIEVPAVTLVPSVFRVVQRDGTDPKGVVGAAAVRLVFAGVPSGTAELWVARDLAFSTGAWAAFAGGSFDYDLPTTTTTTNNGAANDGPVKLYAKMRDAQANETAGFTAQVVLDTEPPILDTVTIGNGNGYVLNDSGMASISVTCIDELSPVDRLRLEVDSDGTEVFGGTYMTRVAVPLGTSEVKHTIDVRCIDWAGHEVAAASQDVFVDYSAPVVGPFTLAGSSGSSGETNNPIIRVTLGAITDAGSGVAAVALAESAIDCRNGAYTYPSSGTFTYTLANTQGEHRLYLCAKDLAGNTSQSPVEAANVMVLDTQAPAAPAIALAAGADMVNSHTVALNVTGGDASLLVKLSGDLALGDATYWYSVDQDVPATATP